MLTYTMDVEPHSIWLRTTPGAVALRQPYYLTEAGLFYGRQNFATSRANKECYLIFYTLSGKGIVTQNGDTVTLGPGDALLLNCRKPQTYRTAPGAAKWDHYWAHVDGIGIKEMEPFLNPNGRLHPVKVPKSTGDFFERLLESIPYENTEAVMNKSLSIHHILTRMVRVVFETNNDKPDSSRALVESAAEYIRAHYTEQVDITMLLEQTHISKSYFMRLFKQYMGTTPYNYLLCYRITQAKEMLELSDLPVKEIAIRVGFNDESNFSTRFSSIAGESPYQYRKSAMTRFVK